MAPRLHEALGFLEEGGTVGALMRAHDWATTPLGPPATWPQSLQTALSICLNAKVVSALYWGREFHVLYNDAYGATLGMRHPSALGRPVSEVWPENWDVMGPQLASVVATGQGLVVEKQPLTMRRHGRDEETFWFYSFAPVRGEDGGVAGVFVTAMDLTGQVLAERARDESERQQKQAADAAALSADFRSVFEASPAPFLVVAPPDWTIVAANDARIRLIGLTREDQIGRRLFDLFPDDPADPGADGVRKLTASLNRVVATKAPDAMAVQRYAVRDADGRFIERWWSPINSPVLDRTGKVALIIHRLEEVTEMVRLRGEAAALDQLARDQQEAIDRLRVTDVALRESETRFRNMADNAPVMMWVTDPTGYCTYLNARWYEFTGQEPGEGEGYGWLNAIHPDDLPLAEQAFVSANAKQCNYQVDFRLRRADGVYRWTIDAAAARFAEDGEYLGYVGSVIDIDERREAEERLAFSEEQLRLAIEVGEIGQWDVDHLTGAMFWPPRVKAMFGISPDVPVTLDDFHNGVHPDDRGKTRAAYEAACDPHHRPLYDVEYRTIGKEDGVVRWVAAKGRGIFDSTGRCVRVIGTAIDVTARKADERRLRELNESLEQQVAERTADRDRMWRLSTDFMLVARFDTIITAVNPAWANLLGWPEDELLGRRFIDLVHPEDVATTLVETGHLAEGRTTLRFENRYQHKDGSYRHLSWTAVPGENLIHAVARDVTAERERQSELEAAQEQLRQAQKMEAVGQLTGGVAHDFNNLLTVIKSSTDLLKRPDLPEERRQRYIGAISDTVARAAKLTGQLLAFARRQALKPEVFDVGRSVVAISDMVGTLSGSRVRIVTDIPDEPCFINADPSQFDTALVNMAVNARDAMDGEGTLTITVHPVSTIPPIRSHPAVHGDFVAVCIEDTGAGIASDQIEHIFEPFFTTKGVGQGTGLGLSQVLGFAKQSGGDVRVQSTVGQGTMFVLYLPQVEAAVLVSQAEPEPLVDGHGTCVLVVEDNADVGTFATQTLAELGYVTVWATNAEEALAELAKDADRFDVVFSDVVMPGMNGIDLAHQIRQDHHDLPVLLASGYSHVLAQNGTYGFELLHKPYSVEQLARLLRKVATWQRRKRIIGNSHD